MSDTQIILGRRIRHYRKSRKMTQRALAAELGVAPNYIASIEQGLKGPSLDKLIEICRWFGISMSDILPVETVEDIETKEKWIAEIAEVCRSLESSQVGFLRTMVRSFCD